MQWETTHLPQSDGNYLVMIERQTVIGKTEFYYVATFDSVNKKWFRNDPFDTSRLPQIEIKEQINGWAYDVGRP